MSILAFLFFNGGTGVVPRLIMAQYILGWLNKTITAAPLSFSSIAMPDYPTAVAGNPFVGGWYADPDTEIYENEYWVYPTYSDIYEKQTFLDAFSSSDLVKWTKHPNILTIDNVKWATKAVWAPAPITRNGRYYIYFGANDIQEHEDEAGMIGGIGVAVSDKPGGPYIDAIGKPLIGHYHNGAQPIDQDVFIDDDGQAYIYYGGHSHANVAKLNEDMISIGTFDDGTQFKEITPENYVEGSQMIKRNGTYYFMWSEGGWTGPDYAVSYAMADSPLGPFPRQAKILQQDPNVATGSGHHGVIHVPGTDVWYIVYHRRPLSETNGNHRVLAYDRMYFTNDGLIAPVNMLVQDNFADDKMIAWKTYGGQWSVAHERLTVCKGSGGMAMLDTNFADHIVDVTIALPHKAEQESEAGIIFRVSDLSDPKGFKGLFVGICGSGEVVIKSFAGDNVKSLGKKRLNIKAGVEHKFRVLAVGEKIEVFIEDMEKAKLSVVTSEGNIRGATGVRVSGTAAEFGNIMVRKPDSA